jgi:hypothetical protein
LAELVRRKAFLFSLFSFKAVMSDLLGAPESFLAAVLDEDLDRIRGRHGH